MSFIGMFILCQNCTGEVTDIANVACTTQPQQLRYKQ